MHFQSTNTSQDYTGLFTASRLYDHLRLIEPGAGTTPADSALIDIYINSAIDFVERYCNVPLLPKTVKMFYDVEPPNGFYLKYIINSEANLTSIKYRDSDNVLQTYDKTDAYINLNRTPNNVVLTEDLPSGAKDITIEYAITSVNVPQGLISGLFLLICHYYDKRSQDDADYNRILKALDQYKIVWHP